MPGITGIISRRPAGECQRDVNSMIAAMQFGESYECGMLSDPEIGVYCGWVAHPTPIANRLFWNEQKDVALVFCGECFFDSDAGVALRRAGHDVGTDVSSWLVHLYEKEGEKFVQNLNGLFSGLLVDKRRGKVFLFNDRYGMERIYWHEKADAFYFASEAKGLLRILPELRRLDERGVAQFLTYGCTFEEQTLFKGIERLPASALWSFENGARAKHKYFSPETWESQASLSAERFECEFQNVFRRALPRYCDSKIPMGISLTAGLDTRMIMACLPEIAPNAVCYTYSGSDSDILDAKLAARVAAACGLEHQTLRIRDDFFAEFAKWADKTVYATDGCFGVIGAHEIYLSRQARDLSPIRLAGIFGGEIFRSVSMFKPLNLSAELFQQQGIAGDTRHWNDHPVTFAAFKEMPWNMFGTVTACRSQLCLRSPYLDNELVSLAYRVPSGLRASSAPAVRLIRNNNKSVANIPTDMGYLGNASPAATAFNKIVARATFKIDYYYNHGLPPRLSPLEPVFRHFAARMQRFGSHRFLNYHNWFRKELASYVSESLADACTAQSPFWNKAFIKRVAEEHGSRRKNYTQEINAVLTLGAVERLLLRISPDASETQLSRPGDSGIRREAGPAIARSAV